jgi:DNA-binding NarL/FixJ family response regulator
VGTRLAGFGWTAAASAKEPTGLNAEAIDGCEVLVVACVEQELVSATLLAELDQIAPGLPRVAVVSVPSDDAAAYAARLGWSGFASAASPTAVIARTIAVVARGQLAFPASATSALARALAQIAPAPANPRSLTPRQQQIVALVAEGATDAEIAQRLRISRFTAYKHVQNARRRLGARTRGQLVAASQPR